MASFITNPETGVGKRRFLRGPHAGRSLELMGVNVDMEMPLVGEGGSCMRKPARVYVQARACGYRH